MADSCGKLEAVERAYDLHFVLLDSHYGGVMVGTLLKAFAYYKAPRMTYTVRHPKNAARLAKTGWDLKHAWAPRATGIAAAAIALPLGYMLGRMTTRRRPDRATEARRARSAPDFY